VALDEVGVHAVDAEDDEAGMVGLGAGGKEKEKCRD
jgi:hypothetical protein